MNNDDISIKDLENKAEMFEANGADSEALDCWQKAVISKPNCYNLCRLGDLYQTFERFEEAKQSYESASKLKPDAPHPYTRLGLMCLELNEPEKAKKYFNKSLAIDMNARVLTFLGVAFIDLAQMNSARRSLRKAIVIDPNYEEAYYNLAVTFRDSNQRKAIALFKKAIEIDAKYGIAYRELGWCLRQLMKLSEAIYYIKKAILIDNLDFWSHIYLGNTFWTNNDLIEAENAFKNAVKISPEDSVGYWSLAFFYERQNQTKKAKKFYQKGVDLNPNDPEANLQFGIFLMQSGEIKKAKTYLELVIDIEPDNKQALAVLAKTKSGQEFLSKMDKSDVVFSITVGKAIGTDRKQKETFGQENYGKSDKSKLEGKGETAKGTIVIEINTSLIKKDGEANKKVDDFNEALGSQAAAGGKPKPFPDAPQGKNDAERNATVVGHELNDANEIVNTGKAPDDSVSTTAARSMIKDPNKGKEPEKFVDELVKPKKP